MTESQSNMITCLARHGFLAGIGAGAALASLPSSLWAADAPRPPNILILITDDQRWDAMGVVQREQGDKSRFPWFATPNMDRLAAEGVRFRNAMVVNSLCSPSRACFLTGRYNHFNGIANNNTAFPTNSVTWATLLNDRGYVTGYIGKWHMGNQSGQRPGFAWSASYIAHGRYGDCPVEVNGVSTPTKGWVDDVSTDFAIEFMRKHQDKPFALQVGFKSPHVPRTPPKRAKDRFAGAKARPVPNLNVPPGFRPGQEPGPEPAGEPSPLPETILDYFRCISAVDDNVGRLLAALDELKLTDNTLVVFTSDNGYYIGEHMLGDKRSMYDESLRIPFLVRLPGRIKPGTVEDGLTLNLDLAPTLCELAGLPVPAAMQGRSWLPLAEGRTAPRREAFLYEYFFENSYATPTIVGVRTTTDKLITYPGHDDWTEVFDMTADPFEIRNLRTDQAQAARLTALRATLERERTTTGYQVPKYADRDGFDALVLKKQNMKQEGKK